MIIKYTFNDNDWTQVIEKYMEEFGPFYAMNFYNYDKYTELRESIMKYDNYIDECSELTEEEFNLLKRRINELLYQSFRNYISNIKENSNWQTDGIDAKELQYNKEWVMTNIKITIEDSLTDKNQNGEVVYFITSNGKYIVV